jgi:hypothetical protein
MFQAPSATGEPEKRSQPSSHRDRVRAYQRQLVRIRDNPLRQRHTPPRRPPLPRWLGHRPVQCRPQLRFRSYCQAPLRKPTNPPAGVVEAADAATPRTAFVGTATMPMVTPAR